MIFSESEIVELKSQVTNDICKEVLAFANTKGGTLYVGVQNDGRIHGVDNADYTILQINNMVRDTIKPDVTMFVGYDIVNVDGKQIIAVRVQKGTDRPYYLGNKGLRPSGVWVRNGTSTDSATDVAIRKMIKDTDGDSFEDMRSLDQNLTFATATVHFSKRNLPLDNSKMQTLGLVSPDGNYSNVAMLLSDQCSSTVKAATFAGPDKGNFQDRREFAGSLFQQMEEVYAYLDLRNNTRSTIEGLYRHDLRDYPEEALREALLNALVHKDYSFSASTLISVYDNRVEFVSVGGLPVGIGLDDIMLGLSVCRNPKLAAVFYRLKLIEAYGTGLSKIMSAYEYSGLCPKIEVTSNAFKITLPNRNAVANMVTEAPVAYNSDEERIMARVEAHGFVVRSDVDAILEVSQATSNRILRRMIAAGLLYQYGRGRSAKYKKVRQTKR